MSCSVFYSIVQVLFAFMVGLHNLYWYYGSQTYYMSQNGVQKLAHTSEAFQGSASHLHFFNVFTNIIYV